jgi:hypothetical protein
MSVRSWVGLVVLMAGCEPAPIVDVAAADLDVRVSLLDLEEVPTDGNVLATMQFFQGGDDVELSSGTSLTCNGVALPYNGLIFAHAGRVPLVAEGGTYEFVHSRSGVDTTLSLTVPARPVLVAPTDEGATVAIAADLTISYTAGAGAAVRGSAGDDATGIGGEEQPDDGSYEGFDVTDLVPGAGSLGITRIFRDTPSGTGFASAQTTYESGASVDVTWQ